MSKKKKKTYNPKGLFFSFSKTWHHKNSVYTIKNRQTHKKRMATKVKVFSREREEKIHTQVREIQNLKKKKKDGGKKKNYVYK